MDPIEKRELKRKAWLRLSAQRRRAGILRGRVVVISLVCFALLWGVVFAQMATGNDPVLSAKGKTGRTTASATPPGHSADHGARATQKAKVREAEPEFEEEPVTGSELIGPEAEEVEAEPEFVEEEPLVTSQS